MAKTYSMTQRSVNEFVRAEKLRVDESMQDDRAFEYVTAQQILTQYQVDDSETMLGLVGGGNDGGYDGIFIFANEALINGEDENSLDIPSRSKIDIHLIQAKNQTGFKEVIIQNWKDSFRNLINSDKPDGKRYSQDIIEPFSLIRHLLSQTVVKRFEVTITFWAVSLAEEVHRNLEEQATELKELVSKIIPAKNVVTEVRFVTASDLYALIDQVPDEMYTLTGEKEPLTPDENSAILTVNLQDFSDFICDKHGNLNKTLFEANIRDYQGDVEVNKAIRQSLESSTDIDFWWLNNGITILADSVTRNMGNSITLTNPRIVNGLQTSNEIRRYRARNTGKETRRVLVKCVAATDQEVKAHIIQATNKQTSIPPSYLHSLESIHLQIERYFKSKGLHYDRRKSSGKNNGIPASEIISVPFLGQCLISTLLQQPNYARARPNQILKDQNKYEKIFNESIDLDAYLMLAKLAAYIRKYIKGGELTRGEQNDLIFHILFAECTIQSKTFEIQSSDLTKLIIPEDESLSGLIVKIHDLYVEMGGTATVAKSSTFLQALKEMISREYSIPFAQE